MGLDYKTVKACYDAQELLKENNHVSPSKSGDRTYMINTYHVKIHYSQQEVTIFPCSAYQSYHLDSLKNFYPQGVGREFFRSPWKEYVYFYDGSGTLRYYLTHAKGLRIQRDGDGYKAMNPVQDYHIEIDRVKAKEARKPVEELYEYISSLWEMIGEPENYNDRPWAVPDILPTMDKREAWYGYLIACKYAKRGGISKYTALARIRQHFTQEHLAYKITPVPDTRMDHTEHWGRIEDIRKAGMLAQWENGNGKKKKKAAATDKA